MYLLNFNGKIIFIYFLLFSISKILSFDFKNDKLICLDRNLKVSSEDVQNNKQFVIKDSLELILCSKYSRSEGWHLFSTEASKHFSNLNKSYALGYLEGYIYYEYINYHYLNVFKTILKNIPLNNKTQKFIYDQFEFTQNLVKDYKKMRFLMSEEEQNYFETLEIILSQYKGLYEGYENHCRENGVKPLNWEDFHILTMLADLEDIIPAFEQERLFKKEKDCSGFVKIVKGNLIVGHNTHNLYTLMNRIYKYYNVNISLSNGRRLNDFKFSSRPGDMNSKDDYYVLSNKMVVLETSLEVKDLSIYKNLKSNTIPKWIRVNIANRLGRNNIEWIDYFFMYNSGTHNNQWILVDFNEFNKYIKEGSKKKVKNIVHIVEQTPLLDKKYFEDFSERLICNSYVASYNAPYFKEVIDTIGYNIPPFDSMIYDHARRSVLFEELNKSVNSIEEAKKVLRYHSKEDICDTIAPRCDLVENRPFGAVDAKITDSYLIKEMKSQIIYGPPQIEGVTEPFNFLKYEDYSHLGIPEVFNFNWINA